MNNWQPIETAPKDGTEVVLWCASAKALLMNCKWHKEGWMEYSVGDAGYLRWYPLEAYEKPTHWMRILPPLPNPSSEPCPPPANQPLKNHE